MQPADPVSARLAAGDIKRGSGRIDGDNPQATRGQQASEGSRAAADIQNGHSAELTGHSGIGIQIGTVGVQRVIDLRELGFLEDRISHGKNPTAHIHTISARPLSATPELRNSRSTI